ncbi:Zonular occludens toxin (Zot) [Acinetobacter venetianus]|uniref:Zonular occludens toxin (Zot) n=1 Tax=Acinetobacter venetianus TaxID=52133 RepID=A0A150HMY6_9GAMM|nr:zonular occludens toxin domain-containing protein [Acinetobacter venetianus]KXZ67581.1 Zonular occludens toxin (Zot) [Acinetobacter venetianus]
MSVLISAPIRTGKTLLAIQFIFEELNKGRVVYTNIVGIKIPGVISVSSSIGEPFDWRDLPNDSVLVWDEAHEHPSFSEKDLLKDFQIDETLFDERINLIESRTDVSTIIKKQLIDNVNRERKNALIKKKEQIKDIGQALLMHGHFGIEIYFITQRVTKLNTDVLASVTNHYVLRRKFGIDAAIIWEFGEAITTWSKSAADTALNKKVWRYPKHLYNFYVSSEKHNVKKTFPLKYLAIALIPIALFLNGFNDAKNSNFFGFFGKKEEPQLQNDQQNSQNQMSQQNLQTQDSEKEIDCNIYQNIHLPECQNLQKQKNEQLNEDVRQSIHYNPNEPYAEYSQSISYKATAQPVFSGCIKYDKKYYGYTQQGTKLNVSESDCKKLIESGDRPFNYFASEPNNNFQQPNSLQQTQPIQQENKMTPEQYIKYLEYLDQTNQANNVVIETQTLKYAHNVNGANAL